MTMKFGDNLDESGSEPNGSISYNDFDAKATLGCRLVGLKLE